MARSLVSSITRPISSLVSPLMKPVLRYVKHPLAPLGMGIAGVVAENISEKVGLTDWLTTAGVAGVDFLKGGAKLGITTIAGIADFDGDDDKKSEKPSSKTNVAGTPNASETLHVGCAKDKACGPCAKKELLAKISGAVEKMTPADLKKLETSVGWIDPPPPPAGAGAGHWEADGASGWTWVPDTHDTSPGHWEHRPKGWVWVHAPRSTTPRAPIPHTSAPATPSQVATQANNAASAYQDKINELQKELQAAKDAVSMQKLTDQIAALQSQVTQANTVAANAKADAGGGLAALLQQLTQLRAIEELLSPAPTPATAAQPVDAWGYPATPPWGSYQDQDGGILQDPNGVVYGNPDINPSAVSDALTPFSSTGDPSFDYWANYSVEGTSGEPVVDDATYPQLGDDGECLPCRVSWD